MEFKSLDDYEDKLIAWMMKAASLLYQEKGIHIRIVEAHFGEGTKGYWSDIRIEINGITHGSTHASAPSEVFENKDSLLHLATTYLRIIYGDNKLRDKIKDDLEKLYYKVSEEDWIVACIASCIYWEGKFNKRF